jgi:hypothetical protein
MEKITIVAKDKASSAGSRGGIVKPKAYCGNYNNHDIIKCIIMHYERNDMFGHKLQSILLQTTIPRGSFLQHWKMSGQREMSKAKESVDLAKTVLCSYLATLKANSKDAEADTSANRYLSPDEEMTFLQIVRGLGCCAKGVTKQEAIAMIDNIVNENVDKQVQVECSEKVFRRMIEKHPDLRWWAGHQLIHGAGSGGACYQGAHGLELVPNLANDLHTAATFGDAFLPHGELALAAGYPGHQTT